MVDLAAGWVVLFDLESLELENVAGNDQLGIDATTDAPGVIEDRAQILVRADYRAAEQLSSVSKLIGPIVGILSDRVPWKGDGQHSNRTQHPSAFPSQHDAPPITDCSVPYLKSFMLRSVTVFVIRSTSFDRKDLEAPA